MTFLSGFDDIVSSGRPMAEFTWLRLGGPAEYFVEPRSVEELSALVSRCLEEDVPVRLLGGGSNILASDEGVAGVVVKLTDPAFAAIAVEPPAIRAGGATVLGHLVSTAVREGLAGLETLVGIPGTVGGALHGNADSHGSDIGQWTRQATVMTRAGEILEHRGDELVFAYRQSSLDELVILEARFELEQDNPEQLTKRMQKQWIMKKANQPMAHQPAGCIFKNLRGTSAGILIEQAGLKGTQVGQAEVSPQHANFIIAHDGATSRDVLALIDLVRDEVSTRLGIDLELEIEMW